MTVTSLGSKKKWRRCPACKKPSGAKGICKDCKALYKTDGPTVPHPEKERRIHTYQFRAERRNPIFGGKIMKMIEVTVSRAGEVSIQTKGYAGTECQQADRFLREALGVKVSEKPTIEMYANSSTEQRLSQQ